MKKQAKVVTLAVLLAAAGLLAYLLPVAAWAQAFVNWVHRLCIAGALVYFLVYVVGTVLMLPGTVLTAGSGFLYGLFWGTLLVSPASVLGATISFLLARSVAREWISRRIADYPRFAAIDRAVAQQGFKVVFLLRLSPVNIPFAMMNYALGLTRVRLRDYVLASWLGMLPATVLYVYLGSIVQNVSGLVHGQLPGAGPWARVLLWVGLAGVVALVMILGRIARQAIQSQLGSDQSASARGGTL